MQALQINRFGGTEGLSLIPCPQPRAAAGEAVVAVRAAAINPSDVKNLAGLMKQTTLPRVPGRDFAGVVVEGPAEWLGQAVWGSGAELGYTRDGSHAAYLRLPLAALAHKPANLDFSQAASVGVAFTTAWLGLIDYAQLQPGETVLVVGAGGNVGQAVRQLARWRGAQVIAADRQPVAPERWAELGLVGAVSTAQDLPGQVRELTAGRGAEVVYDAVGGVMFEPALKSLAHRGRLVEISATGMSRVSFELRDFYHNESRLLGADSLKLDVGTAAGLLERLRPLFEDGTLAPPAVDHRWPLSRAIEAYQAIADGQAGRHVLLMEP